MSVSRAIDIVHLFKGGIFNHEQIHKVGMICKILGKYMFLDRELLEQKAGEKIGLSYIDKCRKNDIITELKYRNENQEKEKYYFQLDVGGLSLLDQAHMGYQEMNILADDIVKSRILTFNYYAHNSGKDIDVTMPQDPHHTYFICCGNIVTYFKRWIKEETLIAKFCIMFGEVDKKTKDVIPLTREECLEVFRFKEITDELIDVGKQTQNKDIIRKAKGKTNNRARREEK
jgi:hypothetical protein